MFFPVDAELEVNYHTAPRVAAHNNMGCRFPGVDQER